MTLQMMAEASSVMHEAVVEIDRLRSRIAKLEAENAALTAAYGQMCSVALNISGAPAGKPQNHEQKGTQA